MHDLPWILLAFLFTCSLIHWSILHFVAWLLTFPQLYLPILSFVPVFAPPLLPFEMKKKIQLKTECHTLPCCAHLPFVCHIAICIFSYSLLEQKPMGKYLWAAYIYYIWMLDIVYSVVRPWSACRAKLSHNTLARWFSHRVLLKKWDVQGHPCSELRMKPSSQMCVTRRCQKAIRIEDPQCFNSPWVSRPCLPMW